MAGSKTIAKLTRLSILLGSLLLGVGCGSDNISDSQLDIVDVSHLDVVDADTQGSDADTEIDNASTVKVYGDTGGSIPIEALKVVTEPGLVGFDSLYIHNDGAEAATVQLRAESVPSGCAVTYGALASAERERLGNDAETSVLVSARTRATGTELTITVTCELSAPPPCDTPASQVDMCAPSFSERSCGFVVLRSGDIAGGCLAVPLDISVVDF